MWWKAEAKDWLFCRLYSYYKYVDQGVSPFQIHLSGRMIGKQLVWPFVLFAVSMSIYSIRPKWIPASWHLIIGIAGYLILALFVFQAIRSLFRQVRTRDRNIHQPASGSEVAYVQLGEAGIRVNWWNDANEQDMPFIAWNRLRRMELMFTEHPDRIQEGNSYHDYMADMRKRFNITRKGFPDFPYEAKKVYEDRFSLLLYHQPAFLSQIPLPPAWGKRQIAQFLAQVEQTSGMRVHPFKYGGERARVFRQELRHIQDPWIMDENPC